MDCPRGRWKRWQLDSGICSGLLKLGTVALDGTKIHANASRHSALSYEHATKIEAQLKAEVAELLARAEAADQAEAVVDGMLIPEELARREERFGKARRGLAPSLRLVPRTVSNGRWPSIAPNWRRGRKRLRMAKSPAADHRHHRSRDRSPRIRST